jgi:hypothetical protein
VAAAVVAAVVAVVIATGSRSLVPVQYGANVNWLFDDLNYTNAQVATQLSALRATGATLARTDALWEAIEPHPPSGGVHHFDWAFDDRIVSMLAQHDLRWLPILEYSPTWAAPSTAGVHPPPDSVADYAAFAGALAARYGPGGTFWRAHPGLASLPAQLFEIWNEPNNPAFWSPQPNPAAYAQLYAAARTAIHAADPGGRALVGGLTLPSLFLPAMLRSLPALRGHIDGVGIHPYGTDPSRVIAAVRGARSVLDSLGMQSVPLYVTEFGWTTQPAGTLNWAPAADRPGYVERTLAELGADAKSCGIDAVTLYTWTTPDQDPRDKEQWYGISPPGVSGGPDVRAFTDGLARARRAPASDGC